MKLQKWFKSGVPWVWLTGGMITISMVMVIGLIMLIAVRGLGHFWPSTVVETTYYENGQQERVLGMITRSETVTALVLREAGFPVPDEPEVTQRYQLKLGNRDILPADFRWFPAPLLGEWQQPRKAMVLERREWGDLIGFLVNVKEEGELIAEGEEAWKALLPRIERAAGLMRDVQRIERYEIGAINHLVNGLRLEERRLRMDPRVGPEELEQQLAELEQERQRLDAEYELLNIKRQEMARLARRDSLTAEVMTGRQVEVNLANIVKAYRPNDMSVAAKTKLYFQNIWSFLSGYPREANTEGGIFPAIFGTVIMVILMSILVTPVGVLAAIYLREYAKQGPFVRLIRISVNNLAGVPSIVFGVFGLGFFVYFLGGNIDRMFYPEALPSPTFGAPGLLWASLTLALLTLPVVIVATEEGLSRIPSSIREGSLALGATKAETLWRTVIPLASPAMMTGLILAVARAAGEVAPLMLVGVVKMAPSLPVDGIFPYLHLERRFMHLGYHIFDVGFQSPNVEAARPLVYATALVLVLIIIVLNLTAITIRNHLREKMRSQSD